MAVLVTIGNFSRMTYLSIKTLRYYHDAGLLVPAAVDQATGYRLYDPAQVATAQVIRRFRDLGMPVERVKAILDAPDVTSRNQLIVDHLETMESRLEQTHAAVVSLRSLLERRPQAPIAVEYRTTPPMQSLAISESVAMDDIETWWSEAFAELHQVLAATGAERVGPDGALYPAEFFELELGEVTAFVPVTGGTSPSGRVRLMTIPAAELAVTVHDGPFSELDQAYGALGTFVAQREIGVDGPIRESYLVTPGDTADETRHRTEVCWPVFQTTTPKH